MSEIWVDTDYGFDDLWALLLLRHLGCAVAGVSLVAGNAPLDKVVANAMGANVAYDLSWPVWQGASRPLQRNPETAVRVLGPEGMRSRGARLPGSFATPPPPGAIDAICQWLGRETGTFQEILALGPLTNIAHLLRQSPGIENRISRLVWMGGSAGRGNHTATAEFNAVADPEALQVVLGSGVRLDIVDLEFCRGVTFTPDDVPNMDDLTRDLLGGYLDIALERGRSGMAIYDPLAALAIAMPDAIGFTNCDIFVSVEPGRSYGATRVTPSLESVTRFASKAKADLRSICLKALKKEAVHGPGQRP